MRSQGLEAFFLLVGREVSIALASWKGILLDVGINILVSTALAGYCLPALGMEFSFGPPFMIGQVINLLISMAFTCSFTLAYDLISPQVIAYHMTLPISKRMVAAAYVAGAVVRIMVFMVPLLFCAMALAGFWSALAVNPISFVVHSLLTSAFMVLLFYSVASCFSVTFLLGSAWPRIIAPIYCFGSVFFPLYKVHSFPLAVRVLLHASPITYCVEGLRAALLGADQYYPQWLLSGVVALWCLALWAVFVRGVSNRLSLVEEAS